LRYREDHCCMNEFDRNPRIVSAAPSAGEPSQPDKPVPSITWPHRPAAQLFSDGLVLVEGRRK
jgi:hypothetical protein